MAASSSAANVTLLHERYQVHLNRVLGEGGFGTVYRAKDLHTPHPHTELAAKRVTRQDAMRSLQVEADVLKKLDSHPCVIQLVHYTQPSPTEAWVLLELASGGELFNRLIDSGTLTERSVRQVALNLFSALTHCLSHGIIHRDVKLENIMLVAEDPNALKLVDFGLAVVLPLDSTGAVEPVSLTDGVGSRSYKAPELFHAAAGYQAPPVDAWSTGIVLFTLLSGFFPLDEARPPAAASSSGDWRFTKLAQDQARGVGACASVYAMYKRPCPFSNAAQQVIDRLLLIDPARRLTIAEATTMPWLSESPHYYDDDEASEVVYRSSSDQSPSVVGARHGSVFDDADGELAVERVPTEAPRLVRQHAAAC